jgi:CheY-like chemotaxis protein
MIFHISIAGKILRKMSPLARDVRFILRWFQRAEESTSSKRIADQEGGVIMVHGPGESSMIYPSVLSTRPAVFFDQGEEPWTEPGKPDRPGQRPGGVLVVDDDEGVRTVLNLLLGKQGYVVWLTGSGVEAVQVYRRHRQAIDLVLLDVRMPGLDGPHTLTALQQLNPQLRFCFMTGDPGRYTEKDLLARGAERIFCKPFCLNELVRTLEQLMPDTGAR